MARTFQRHLGTVLTLSAGQYVTDPLKHAAPKKWARANYVPAPHFYNLNQACTIINKALGDFGCYLVGSALERKDWRDIDVRFIMADVAYDRMFRDESGWLNPLWSLICTTWSAWLSQQSGLPVDFQIQRQSRANAEHDGKRSPLGFFHDYPGDRPSETVAVDEGIATWLEGYGDEPVDARIAARAIRDGKWKS